MKIMRPGWDARRLEVRRTCWLACAVFAAALASAAVMAQQPDADVVPLEFSEVAQLPHSRVAVVEGEVDAEGLRFALPDLSILQPVELRLAATDPARPVRLEVTKFGFDGVLKEGTTDGEGLAVLRFRTQMGVSLGVKAVDSTAPFQLLAWVGDELEAVPRNVLTPMSRDEQGTGQWWLYAIAGGAVAAVIALLFARRRKPT